MFRHALRSSTRAVAVASSTSRFGVVRVESILVHNDRQWTSKHLAEASMASPFFSWKLTTCLVDTRRPCHRQRLSRLCCGCQSLPNRGFLNSRAAHPRCPRGGLSRRDWSCSLCRVRRWRMRIQNSRTMALICGIEMVLPVSTA